MVICMNITIRNLDDALFRKFKSEAVSENVKLGTALNQAMRQWISIAKKTNKNKLGLIKPFDWGKGSEKVSMEVDRIVYGDQL